MGQVVTLTRKPEWQFTVSFYKRGDKWSAEIEKVAGSLETGDQLRHIAEGMDAIRFQSLFQAEESSPTEDGSAVAIATIYESGKATLRTNDKLIGSKELADRFAEIREVLLDDGDETEDQDGG